MTQYLKHQAYHPVFVLRVTLCHEERQSSERWWSDMRPVKHTRTTQKPDKRICPASLVSISKRMIFYDEIEKMRCFCFDTRIDIVSVKRLKDISDDTRDASAVTLSTEEFCRLTFLDKRISELGQCLYELIGRQGNFFLGSAF